MKRDRSTPSTSPLSAALPWPLVSSPPPYGLCLLISCQIAGINVVQPLKEVGAFLAAMLFILLLTVFFPAVSLGIPQFVMPNIF